MFGIDSKWEVRRCLWPFPEGYAVYQPSTHTVLDTGLPTREDAQAICDEMNSKKKERKGA